MSRLRARRRLYRRRMVLRYEVSLRLASHPYRTGNVCVDEVERVTAWCDSACVRALGHATHHTWFAHTTPIFLRIIHTGCDVLETSKAGFRQVAHAIMPKAQLWIVDRVGCSLKIAWWIFPHVQCHEILSNGGRESLSSLGECKPIR